MDTIRYHSLLFGPQAGVWAVVHRTDAAHGVPRAPASEVGRANVMLAVLDGCNPQAIATLENRLWSLPGVTGVRRGMKLACALLVDYDPLRVSARTIFELAHALGLAVRLVGL